MTTTSADELREEVRRRYAESARAVSEAEGGPSNVISAPKTVGSPNGRAASAKRTTP